jgi:hypothetical protein
MLSTIATEYTSKNSNFLWVRFTQIYLKRDTNPANLWAFGSSFQPLGLLNRIFKVFNEGAVFYFSWILYKLYNESKSTGFLIIRTGLWHEIKTILHKVEEESLKDYTANDDTSPITYFNFQTRSLLAASIQSKLLKHSLYHCLRHIMFISAYFHKK